MKKLFLLVTSIALSNAVPLEAYYSYYDQARHNVARQDAFIQQARIQAEADRLCQQDVQAFVDICKGIVYFITSTGKVICQRPLNDNTEKFVGTLGTALIAVAAAAGLYKIFEGNPKPKKKKLYQPNMVVFHQYP